MTLLEKRGLVWSVDNPAPMGDLREGLQTSMAAAGFSIRVCGLWHAWVLLW